MTTEQILKLQSSYVVRCSETDTEDVVTHILGFRNSWICPKCDTYHLFCQRSEDTEGQGFGGVITGCSKVNPRQPHLVLHGGSLDDLPEELQHELFSSGVVWVTPVFCCDNPIKGGG